MLRAQVEEDGIACVENPAGKKGRTWTLSLFG